jgi:DNA-binding transcriptional regulator GbsR (MarR family)
MSAPAPVSANREFSRECVKFFGEIVQIFGVPPSVGQIFGLLYASPEPLSFSDLVERLEISKGSASQGLQLLRNLGAVHAVENSEGRREYFEPELSLRQLVSGVLRERIAPMAAAGGDRLERLRKLAEQDGQADDFCLDRVEQLETWRRRLRTVLPVLTTLLGPKRRK